MKNESNFLKKANFTNLVYHAPNEENIKQLEVLKVETVRENMVCHFVKQVYLTAGWKIFFSVRNGGHYPHHGCHKLHRDQDGSDYELGPRGYVRRPPGRL